ncbi:hypothetical protein VNO77_01265 [Canavalia gladiata]|uniref:Protein RALF-like 32 n=1 Tax=Canavalia gladiata TaxID=3824 RepID=A0AAN9MQW4_CANGL
MESQKSQNHAKANKYITMEVTKRNIAPCSKNCQPPASNPYNRGCSMICRLLESKEMHRDPTNQVYFKGTSKTQNRRMASKSSTIRLVSFCYLILFSFMQFSSTGLSWTSQASTCNGSIAECNLEDELLMESEISRRFLQQKSYISNGALKRDKPVCNGGGSGEAYSKTGGCLPPPSNPENRGCSKYYRCRSDS